MKRSVVILVVGLMAVACVAGPRIVVEAGNAVTFGEFNYGDSTITIDSEVFNPRVGAELCIPSTPLAFGAEYAQSENGFDGEYDASDGTLDVERREILAFLRLGSKNRSNVRFAYRNFQYDISDAVINQREDDGSMTEKDENGEASGDLTTGFDVEATLAIGTSFQVAFTVGGSYFADAEYEYEYDITEGDGAGAHESGEAKLDAATVRVRPEISIGITEDLRVFGNYTFAGTAWSGTLPEDSQGDEVSYPGIDLYSAIGFGARYTFGS